MCARRRSLLREHPRPSRALVDQLVRLPDLLGWRPGGAAVSRSALHLAVRPAGEVHLHTLRGVAVRPDVPDVVDRGEVADDRREHRRPGAHRLDDPAPARLAGAAPAGCGAAAQRGGVLVRTGAARGAPGPGRADLDGRDRVGPGPAVTAVVAGPASAWRRVSSSCPSSSSRTCC